MFVKEVFRYSMRVFLKLDVSSEWLPGLVWVAKQHMRLVRCVVLDRSGEVQALTWSKF